MKPLSLLAALAAMATTALAGTVMLGWSPSPTVDQILGYRLYQATNISGPFAVALSIAPSATNATLTLAPGRYFWFITSTNLGQESYPSSIVTTNIPLTSVTNLTISTP